MRPARALLLASVVFLASSAQTPTLEAYDFGNGHRFALPPMLGEVSGLAMSGDGRLFAHADEQAIVVELDPRTGQVRKAFTLGQPALRGDFEGIAFARGRFFLVTSTGLIYSAPEGPANGAVAFQQFESGAGRFCEIEGLAYDAAGDRLLLPCKTPRVKELRDRLTVLAVPLGTMRVQAAPVVSLPSARVAKMLGSKQPPRLTSIEVHPRTRSLLLLGSGPSAVIEASGDGSLLGAVALSARAHPQPEGLTLTGDLTLLIADEGGTTHGTLTSYAVRKRNP